MELACQRALNYSSDDKARMMLLEALASFKATPLSVFPARVVDLANRSREQADALTVSVVFRPRP